MRRSSSVLLALLGIPLLGVLMSPGSGTAQDWRPEWGDRSIAFAMPGGGGGGLGIWWHRAGRRSRALELDLDTGASLDVGGEVDRYSLQTTASLGLAFKRYGAAVGSVSPHLYGGTGIRGHWRNQGANDPSRAAYSLWGAGAYTRLGLGVDWFPLERISVGGHTGGSLDYWYQNPPAGTGLTGDQPRRHSLAFGLFTSGLSLHIYF